MSVLPPLERIRKVHSGTTLSWQCSRSTTNAISTVFLFCVCVCVCVCVCDAIYIYMYPLLPRCVVCVCVCVCVCVSIYLRMYLSICSWSLPCQRCLCWSLPSLSPPPSRSHKMRTRLREAGSAARNVVSGAAAQAAYLLCAAAPVADRL